MNGSRPMSSKDGSGSVSSPHSSSASRWARRSATGSFSRWCRAKERAPEVVSWPAIRNVMTWLRMLARSRRGPVLALPGAAEHQAQQIVVTALAARGTGGDDLVDDGREVVRVGTERRVLRGVVGAGVAGELGHAPLQAAHHRLDERVRGVAGERGEVEAEAGEPDGVQRHPGHVLGDVDGGAVGHPPVPAVHHPAGDLEHRRVVGAHRTEREGRHQDLVRPGPVRLIVVGGEQTVPGELSDVLQDDRHALGEAGLVGDLGDQVQRGDEQRLAVAQLALEGRAVDPGEVHGLLDGRAGEARRREVGDRGAVVGGGAFVGVQRDGVGHVSSVTGPVCGT